MSVTRSIVIRVKVGRSLHIPCIFRVQLTESAITLNVSLNGKELKVILGFGVKATGRMGLLTDLGKMGRRADLEEAILSSVLCMLDSRCLEHL